MLSPLLVPPGPPHCMSLGVREAPSDPAPYMQTHQKRSPSGKFTQQFLRISRWHLTSSHPFFLPCWGSACSLGLP